MTIDEIASETNGPDSVGSNGRDAASSTNGGPGAPSDPHGRSGRSLAARFADGEPFGLVFGGQGAPWLDSLAELVGDGGLEAELQAIVTEAAELLAPVEQELVVVRPSGFDPLRWIHLDPDDPDTRSAPPSAATLRSAAVSAPGVLLTQLAALRILALEGLDLATTAPVAVAGHSQGVLAAAAVEAGGKADAQLVATAQLLGAAGTLMGRRRRLIAAGDRMPMLAVSDVDPARLRQIMADLDTSGAPSRELAPVIAIRNGRRRVVVSGAPDQLDRLVERCAAITAEERAGRDARRHGGAVFAPVFEPIPVEVGFHHLAMVDAVALVGGWAERCGLDIAESEALARSVLVDPFDWVDQVDEVVDAGARWILDLGPKDLLARMTAGVARGQGVGVIAASTRGGRRSLFSPGAEPAVERPWSDHLPTPVRLPDGTLAVETAFTRLTGRSPILLAGMTPTTVDAAIVAAAANAGHWAELAGGGQVTEDMFAARIVQLTDLLEPGRAVQFNALFLDPYLWKMQLGGKRLVQRARAAGAPIDGVTVSAGIPELADAVALVEELAEAGISHVVFKPGTVAQIRSVIRIAAEVPDHSVIVHIEGGRAGGHHSWEDLDDLLISTYAELRARPNIVVCVGGGIGTPERAAEYLAGRWSESRGYAAMPLDGILVGTAAMATLEATTSPEVKQLLVDTVGSPDWIGAGEARAGMASGRSQLGADIHEVDNAASRCGRLLDDVAGDADAVAARRDEIVAALDATAKPYFGDVAAMTYRQWLLRYLELAIGSADEQGTDLGEEIPSVWLDHTWRDRFSAMLQRAEARLHSADRGEIPTLFGEAASLERPAAAIAALSARYPDAATTVLHPADVPFFVAQCRTPGKPVNFVPVIDAEVRRWWRSDSLWQAHDDRYPASAVSIIPGPVAVGGIDRVDEPVAELLDRFERAAFDELVAAGVEPREVAGRRRSTIGGGTGQISDRLSTVLASPDLQWASRTTQNPLWRLGDRGKWAAVDPELLSHGPTGATLRVLDADHVELCVPLRQSAVRMRITVPPSCGSGGAPIVTDDDAAQAMSELLAIAAGGSLPTVVDGVARMTVAWDPDDIADHAGVTGLSMGRDLGISTAAVPDVIVGACWPAVFAVLGAARTTATPDAPELACIEGLLDLVHLDHHIELVGPLPTSAAALVVRAECRSVQGTDVGRVVEIDIEVADPATGVPVARLVERLAIRGRTGPSELTDPARPGGARATETARRRRRDTTLVAPVDMSAFAQVSGDHNPIHTEHSAALLAGLGGTIIHGMWLSAAAQHVVTAGDGDRPSRRLTGWTGRFLAPVRPGSTIDVRVDRVGLDAGAELVEVSCRVEGDLVFVATGRTEAPRTVYAFPGQGIQRAGMGLEARARSKAARKVWDRADRHTRDALGFSILAVVRDNPTVVRARGVEHRHPDGVLFLTQFTQVAMATLGVVQMAELRESGAYVEDAICCGHSVGEYNALAAVSGVLPLESVLEVVFQRGMAMHALVPRDSEGRSDYRLAAIRPSEAGLTDDDVPAFVAGVAERSGEFVEIVNYNLRGSQYAIAGTVRGLAALEGEVDARREAVGGKRAFILVPGIDVPFHSSVLRPGVPAFRERLEQLLPEHVDPAILVGRYIPNLVPRLFSLDRAFINEIAELVPSEPLEAVLADFDTWSARPSELCRVVLIELLAWQFASPVRWIETQDLLFGDPATGGLGIERFVEIGLATAPTLANLASSTVALPGRSAITPEIFNIERDTDVLRGTDVDPARDDEADDDAELAATVEGAGDGPAVAAAAAPVTAPAVPSAPSGGPRPDDLPFTAADATTALVALWTKLRTDQIGAADTIESLCDGVSSRRNQLLVDLGAELSLGAIDGAADADIVALSDTVKRLARTYRPFGPVLGDQIDDQLRRVLGPSGRRPAAIADRVRTVWELEPGWVHHVLVELTLGTREGVSVRGGPLGGMIDAPPTDGSSVDALIDAAILAVGARHGVAVSQPSTASAGGTVDLAALGEFTDQLTGRDGVLASAARLVLDRLGHTSGTAGLPDLEDLDAAVVARVADELGAEWPRLVAPAFEPARALLIDDRWATAREDLARMWIAGTSAAADASEIPATTPPADSLDDLARRFDGAGDAVRAQAAWWQNFARTAGRSDLAERYQRIADSPGADGAEADGAGRGIWSDEVAVVTGASVGSIAASVVGELLAGGATVIATTSRLDTERLEFYRSLYARHARDGAALWVVPANLASFLDVDAVIRWIGAPMVDTAGGTSTVLKEALTPTMLFPFAAPRVGGELADAGPRAELEFRVLLWSVERLISGLAAIGADHDVDTHLHVILPGSPNRGRFGGDGAYGEAKAAFDAVVARWRAERSWADRVTLVHAAIGWVRGTGLMGHNDPLVDLVEAAGVRTWSTDDMAAELLSWCDAEARRNAAVAPIEVDLTGGLAEADLDLSALRDGLGDDTEDVDDADDALSVDAADADTAEATITALPTPPGRSVAPGLPSWPTVDTPLSDMVVIIGAGELGPYGSSRTRFEMEVGDELSAAGVVELAWNCGLIAWEQEPVAGWYDTASGDLVPEGEIVDRYHDTILEHCGIRTFDDDGPMIDGTQALLASVFLERDLSFVVGSEAEARAFVDADADRTSASPVPDSSDWEVTRRAGTEIRVPRRLKVTRTVGGQIPSGFDPTRWGIPADMVSSLDRVAVWNLVATVDAFIAAGVDPSELLRWVHPSQVANTQGVGMGAMTALRTMYVGSLLGDSRANDTLQEALPNVVAAHVVQSYVGSYGAMIHPVAACATAAVSVEEGVDKIRLGKADVVVAGGYDDLGVEGIIGFADMSATADSAVMSAKGIADRRFSRANDRRRGGFVEAQGGGTVLLARADLAAEMGLPVLGVIGWAGSFADGVHTSIPAPGIGALGAGRGGPESKLARSLAALGVAPDDIAVVSKHDTSTGANDPNESELHERLATAIGRSEGAPLFVISQKSLTGHAKGGAAAFQLIGLCQALTQGVVPPNRSLDCVDDKLAVHPRLVWPRRPLHFGEDFPLRAGLLTSLGFGHVSALIAVVHPAAFVNAIDPADRQRYLDRSAERTVAGRRRLLDAMCGGSGLYERPPDRRFGHSDDDPTALRTLEAEVLLDPAARLGLDGVFEAGTRPFDGTRS